MPENSPGDCRIAEVEYVASRTITDAKNELVITSYTANPHPHVEAGRDYDN